MPTGQSQRLMSKSLDMNRALGLLLMISLVSAIGAALAPQGVPGGASAFQGQDIMGGAAIVFKRPPRMRDIVGATGMLVVKLQRKVAVKPSPEVAKNVTVDRHRPTRPRPTVVPEVSNEDQAEAFKNQGNTYYDLGDFPHAIEAYLKALKYTPKDPVIFNNLGAAYFSSSKYNDAADAFNKSLALKPNDPDAFFNLGIAYSSLEKYADAAEAFNAAARV